MTVKQSSIVSKILKEEEWTMCRPVKCDICGKTTWAGCGQHIDAVKASVPANDWCPGHCEENGNRQKKKSVFSPFLARQSG